MRSGKADASVPIEEGMDVVQPVKRHIVVDMPGLILNRRFMCSISWTMLFFRSSELFLICSREKPGAAITQEEESS
jgi:hypothetical protein